MGAKTEKLGLCRIIGIMSTNRVYKASNINDLQKRPKTGARRRYFVPKWAKKAPKKGLFWPWAHTNGASGPVCVPIAKTEGRGEDKHEPFSRAAAPQPWPNLTER
jgi:hypothetical protein